MSFFQERVSQEGSSVICARILLPIGAVMALAACEAAAPPPASGIVVPGPGKDQAAFQQDDQVCREHAVAQTGYGAAGQTPNGGATSGNVAPPPGGSGAPLSPPSGPRPSSESENLADQPLTVTPNPIGYMQCMAARGDTVQSAPWPGPPGYAAAYAGSPHPYGYPYPYGFVYPYPYDGLDGVWGWGGGVWIGGRWHGGAWHGGGWHGRGGFARGGGGGGHR
jgi:hypothetical protein